MPTSKKPTDSGAPEPTLNREDLERLIELVHAKGFQEFELEHGSTRLRLVGQRTAYAAGAPAPAPVSQLVVPAMSAGTPADPAEDPRLKKVTSPMVGTFYRAASPGSKTFVEVGDRVDEDTVLCIIEAMKLMNEIKAEMRGTIRKILVDNAHPVEYGQALFLVDPN